MSQTDLIYILIIALVGAAALSVNYYFTRREQHSQARHERLQWLHKEATHLLDAITLLKSAGAKPELLERLNQKAIRLIEEISLLAPDSELMAHINSHKETADHTQAGEGDFKSDKELKRFQIYINFTEKLLEEMLKKGEITPQLARTFGQDIYWLNISTVAQAHINQANQLLETDDKLSALSHLKHAKAVLVRAMVPPALKQPKLAEIQPVIDAIQPKKSFQGGALADSLDVFLE